MPTRPTHHLKSQDGSLMSRIETPLDHLHKGEGVDHHRKPHNRPQEGVEGVEGVEEAEEVEEVEEEAEGVEERSRCPGTPPPPTY